MNKELIIAVALGALIYFLMEFRSKRIQGFSVWYWIKDNWYNVVLTCLIMYALVYIGYVTDRVAALLLGYSANGIIDRFQDIMSSKKIGS